MAGTGYHLVCFGSFNLLQSLLGTTGRQRMLIPAPSHKVRVANTGSYCFHVLYLGRNSYLSPHPSDPSLPGDGVLSLSTVSGSWRPFNFQLTLTAFPITQAHAAISPWGTICSSTSVLYGRPSCLILSSRLLWVMSACRAEMHLVIPFPLLGGPGAQRRHPINPSWMEESWIISWLKANVSLTLPSLNNKTLSIYPLAELSKTTNDINFESSELDEAGEKMYLLRILANPKSQILIIPCLVMRMFSGFTSRWIHCKIVFA